MVTREERLRDALSSAFDPVRLDIVDDSAHHAGHAGATPAGETHYAIVMVSAAFRGQSRVARSRAVHAQLAPEFSAGLHAVSLRLLAPDEPP